MGKQVPVTSRPLALAGLFFFGVTIGVRMSELSADATRTWPTYNESMNSCPTGNTFEN